MAISSDALFHFTNSRFNLESILTNRFKLTYCKENFYMGDSPSGNFYFPMISFCDLPLGTLKERAGKYGNYAIGMSKEWGIKHKLNPVLYLERDSTISKDIIKQMDYYESMLDAITHLINDKTLPKVPKQHVMEIFDNFMGNLDSYKNLYRFIKNYEGDLTRGDKVYKNYRFYDEKEWRYVPEIGAEGIKWKLKQEEYIEYRGKEKRKKLLETPVLDFNSNDIKYLVVKSNKDIPQLIRKIKSIDKLCSNSDQSDVLITKILTVDSLGADF